MEQTQYPLTNRTQPYQRQSQNPASLNNPTTSQINQQTIRGGGFNFYNSHYAITKQRHYAALNFQLERLQNNMAKLERHVETTAEQLRMIQNFGIAQGALFIAANRVLGPEDREEIFSSK
ncbi:hypothetical protein G9A89_008074 [Geosiphon pyriformis]|nr:hypothetical protein G9A89_008074 [Geosiphon pyriformis]